MKMLIACDENVGAIYCSYLDTLLELRNESVVSPVLSAGAASQLLQLTARDGTVIFVDAISEYTSTRLRSRRTIEVSFDRTTDHAVPLAAFYESANTNA